MPSCQADLLRHASGLQEESTGTYMQSSFAMQLHVGRFCELLALASEQVELGADHCARADINTLGLRDITSQSDVQPTQIPVIKTAVRAALEIQGVVTAYGADRMAHATEFTLISSSVRSCFSRLNIHSSLTPLCTPTVSGPLPAQDD